MSEFMDSFVQILKSSWQDDFIRGIIVGIGCYLVLVLLVHLLFIIFRRRKKSVFFELPGEAGSIIVSIKAVTGVMKQELAHFSQLEISRITVYRVKAGYSMEIRGQFMPGQSGTPALYAAVAGEVQSKMNSIFGIDNISKVDLRIDSCKREDESYTEDPQAVKWN